MPRFHPDTIAALAEGRLDPDQTRELERAIADDPVALAELAAHRTALSAARNAPTPTLSTAERTLLRSAVAGALGVEQPGMEPAMRRRRVPWAAISVAAAALVALMAVVPLANLLSTGGESAAAPTFDAAAELSTTIAASLGEDSTGSGGDTPTTPTLAGVDAVSETTISVAGVERIGAGDDEARERLAAAFEVAPSADASSPGEDTPCFAEAVAYLGEAPMFTVSFDTAAGGTVVAFSIVDSDGVVTNAVGFDPSDCTITVSLP